MGARYLRRLAQTTHIHSTHLSASIKLIAILLTVSHMHACVMQLSLLAGLHGCLAALLLECSIAIALNHYTIAMCARVVCFRMVMVDVIHVDCVYEYDACLLFIALNVYERSRDMCGFSQNKRFPYQLRALTSVLCK